MAGRTRAPYGATSSTIRPRPTLLTSRSPDRAPASHTQGRPGHVRAGCPEPPAAMAYRLSLSDRPPLLAVAHVPEHPLVPAGGAEVLVHQGPLGRPEPGPERVGDGQHLAHRVAELLAPVGVDPLLVA